MPRVRSSPSPLSGFVWNTTAYVSRSRGVCAGVEVDHRVGQEMHARTRTTAGGCASSRGTPATGCEPSVPSTEPSGSKSAASASWSRSSTAQRVALREPAQHLEVDDPLERGRHVSPPGPRAGAVGHLGRDAEVEQLHLAAEVHARVASSAAKDSASSRALRSRAEAVGRLGQDRAQDVGDVVELVVTRDERRRELHHGVAPVVGAARSARRRRSRGSRKPRSSSSRCSAVNRASVAGSGTISSAWK